MFFTDLFFPKFCLGCGYIGVYLCASCQSRLKPTQSDFCLYCNKPSLFGLTHSNCKNKLNIDGTLTLFHYNPMLKKIIKNIKYRLATEVWHDFYLAVKPGVIEKLGFYRKLSSDFLIQPIPLTKGKLNERGFNQAKIISEFFRDFLDFPIADLLSRQKEVRSQAQTRSRLNRYINLKGVFELTNNWITGCDNIILVDDVVTTGSTVKEAARVLKKAGVEKVYVLALAKG